MLPEAEFNPSSLHTFRDADDAASCGAAQNDTAALRFSLAGAAPVCELAHQRYDSGDSELKQGIPVSLLGKVLDVSKNGIETWG
jgi:hypothetical protein